MGAPIGSWNATYTPGSWVVLSGPRSMVILQPAPARVSKLIQRFWRDMMECSNIDEVSVALANRSLAQLDSYALLFDDDAGLHLIVKGAIKVVDTATQEEIIAGDRADTWMERALGHDQSIRVEMDDVDPLSVLHLPLLVGGGLASSVFVTTRVNAQVTSVQSIEPQPVPAPEALEAAEDAHPDPEAAAPVNLYPPIAELPDDFDEDPNEDPNEDVCDDSAPQTDLGDFATEDLTDMAEPPLVPAERSPVDEAFFSQPDPVAEPPAGPGPTQPAPADHSVVVSMVPVNIPQDGDLAEDSLVPPPNAQKPAMIRANFGVSQPLSGPVFVGRAPDPGQHLGARIIKVPSQHTDISRNHIRVSAEHGRVVVTDLHSTNGSVLVVPQEDPRRLEPGQETSVPYGSIIDLGDGIQLRIDEGR